MSGKWGRSIVSIALSLFICVSEIATSGTAVYASNLATAGQEFTSGDSECAEEKEIISATEESEQVEEVETAEETEETAVTDDIESSETSETTETAETTEATEHTEATEQTETAESTEATEKTETTECAEESVSTEETEETETVEVTEETEEEELAVVQKIKGAGLEADTIPLNGSITYTASSVAATYFKVDVTTKGYLSINAISNTGADDCGSFLVGTLDSDSKVTALTDSYSVSKNGVNSDKVGVEPGTYYVVYTKTGSDALEIKFTCNYKATDDWESEGNDSFKNADGISLNKTYYGNTLVGVGAQEDYYKFSMTKDGAIKVDFLHDIYAESGEYYTVYLYNANYDVVASFPVTGGSTSTSSAMIGLVAGDYYVRVHGGAVAYEENCEYRFKVSYTASEYWEKENNEKITASTQISLNQTYNGSLKSATDVDFYKMKLSKDGYVSINFGHALLENVNDIYYHVYLYGEDGATVYSEFDSKGNSVSYSDTKIGLAAGTYYIKIVDKAYYDNGTYSLKVNFKASTVWEKESNGNVNVANKISLDKWYNGALASSSDLDFYKFTINSAGCVNISLKHANLADSTNYFYVYLYDKEFNQLTVFSSTGFQENFTLKNYGLDKGTYYIKVSAMDSKNIVTAYSNTSYAVKVTHTEVSGWETENNDTFKLADKLTLGTAKTGIIAGEDTDMYKFTLSEKSWINVSFSHADTGSTEKQWQIRLYDNLGNTVYYDARNKNVNAYMYVQGTSTYNSLNANKGIQLAAGTYYIKVCNWVGYSETPYKLTVSKVKIKAPQATSAKSDGYNKLKISWKSVAGADQYLIYRSTSKDGEYKKIATVTGEKTSYTNSGLSCGKTYYYKIKAVGTTSKKVTSGYSKVVSGKPVPAKASVTLASDKKKQVKVSWKAVSGASGYEIYYSTKKDSGFKKVKNITKGKTVNYTQNSLKSGKTYYYKVRAYRTVNGKKVYGSYSSVKSVKVK